MRRKLGATRDQVKPWPVLRRSSFPTVGSSKDMIGCLAYSPTMKPLVMLVRFQDWKVVHVDPPHSLHHHGPAIHVLVTEAI